MMSISMMGFAASPGTAVRPHVMLDIFIDMRPDVGAVRLKCIGPGGVVVHHDNLGTDTGS